MLRPLGALVLLTWLGGAGPASAEPRAPTRARAVAAPKKAAAATKPGPTKPGTTKARTTKPGTTRTAGKGERRLPRWGAVELFHINRRETMRLRIADDRGRPVRGVQGRIDRFLRCHYTNVQKRMNPRLTRLLYETGRHFPGRRIEVISGYRHPKVAKNPRSPHMKGLACDFRVAGVKNSDLRDFLRKTFKSIGVGYYPNSSFVHLDIRNGASAFWIDYSGPGESSLYSDNPGADLKTGKAESFRPTKIDPSWAESDDTPAIPVAPPPADQASPPASGSGESTHLE